MTTVKSFKIIPITAIIITYNEQFRLRECIESLLSCDQIIAVDLGSDDESVEIAVKCGVETRTHALVPYGEKALPDVIPFANNDWILRFDPDEIWPGSLLDDIRCEIEKADDDLAMLSLPHHYFFRGRHLKTTRWGRVHHVVRVFHKDRIKWSLGVHGEVTLCKEGYRQVMIPARPDNCVKHFWVDTYQQLFEKHRRYLLHEGESRYSRGERFRWIDLFSETYLALKHNLITRRGLLGGWSGIFLSFFYAWYIFNALMSLRSYQKRLTK